MKELLFELPGIRLAVKASGDPANPPVLALHGWLDNANSFDWLAQSMSDYYLLAVDLPGHGLSGHLPPGCHYHFTDGIFTILELIKAMGYRKMHLLGHSMGACLSSLVAGVAPEMFYSLLLIEGLGPFSSPGDSACLQLKDYLLHQFPSKLAPKGYPSLGRAAQARSKRGHVSYDLAYQLCLRGLSLEQDLYYWRHDRRLLIPSPLRMTEEQILSCLEHINLPTCLIWASNGFSFNGEELDKRMQVIADLSVYELEGGHHIHMEKPEEVAKLLLNFMSSRNFEG